MPVTAHRFRGLSACHPRFENVEVERWVVLARRFRTLISCSRKARSGGAARFRSRSLKCVAASPEDQGRPLNVSASERDDFLSLCHHRRSGCAALHGAAARRLGAAAARARTRPRGRVGRLRPRAGHVVELPPTGLLAHIEGHVSFQMEGKRHGDGCNWRKVTKPVVVAVEVRVDGEPVLGTIRELNMTAADHYEVHDFGMYVPLPPGGSEIEVFARWADSTKPKCRVFFKPPQYHRLQALVWEARE